MPKLHLTCIFLVAFTTAQAQTPAVVLQDADFSAADWVSRILKATSGNGTFTAVTESSGGNPGSYRHVIHNIQGDSLTVTHLRLTGPLLSYSPGEQGAIRAITYSFDAKVIQGAAGQSYQLLLYQNGTTYAASPVHKTDGLTSWTTIASPNSIDSGQFSRIDGTGPPNPDFSASAPSIYFGYLTSNAVPQTCDMYYGCYTNTSATTLDTGIDNLTINIWGTAVPTGVTCAISPVNHFIPFHIPSLHVSQPDLYPNHTLKVLVTSNGMPSGGVAVTISSSQTALSLTPKAPPTLTVASAMTDDDGNAVFYHNTPASGAYSRTDFKATGSLGGNDFNCQTVVITGIGAATAAVLNFFGSPAQQPSLLALHALLLKDRTLTNNLEQQPKYQALIRRVLGMERSSWSSREARALPGLLNQLGRKSRCNTRDLLAGLKRDLRKAAENRHSVPRDGSPALAKRSSDTLPPVSNLNLRKDFGRLPLGFERNAGQFPREVRYLARAAGFNLALTGEGAVLVNASSSSRRGATASTMQMGFPGARSPKKIVALDEQPGTTNYLIGSDPAKWRKGISRFGRVKYESIYPGIDLVFHGRQREVEFDFVVAPGTHPEKIRIGFRGDVRLEHETGGLILHDMAGSIHLRQPTVYQEENGSRKTVDGQFVALSGNQVGFQVGAYNADKPLVIDPVLSYSSFLGGSDYDAATAVAVDSQGNVYVTGLTFSVDFPTLNPLQAKLAGAEPATGKADAFVTKIDPTGTKLIYSTYISGGGKLNTGLGIAVDGNGNAYMTGETNSPDFPLVHPIQSKFGGGPSPSDAFVLKLGPTGSTLVYSTYLGGSGDDEARAISVDSNGNAYVVGQTSSQDFPLKNPLQAHNRGQGDAFITKIDAAGTGYVYSTFLGGAFQDMAMALAVDAAGNAYVTGMTYSADFPTANPLQAKYTGGADGFVAKLSADGSTLVYSTYLGGESDDIAMGIGIDKTGSAYVTGVTGSPDFPVMNALQPKFGSSDGLGADAFLTKLDPSGSHLVYSTFLGGNGIDTGLAVAVGADGSAFVAGETESPDFPTVDALQPAGGSTDAFLAKLNPAGSQLLYSTTLGGSGDDSLAALVLDSSGNVFLAGTTGSKDFPATNGAYQTSSKGATDVLVLKITEGTSIPKFSTVSAASFQAGPVAPDAIVTGFGDALAASSQPATKVPLPTELAGTSVRVKDSAGNEQAAPLFFVSEKQINYLIPSVAVPGLAAISVVSQGQPVAAGTVQIKTVAPALFSANADGSGVAAGSFVRVAPNGTQQLQSTFQCGASPGSCTPVPMDLGDGTDHVYLLLFGTGIRGRSDLSAVQVTLNGMAVPVVFAGAQGQLQGQDQVNIGPLPLSLVGAGEVNLVLTVDGNQANVVSVSIK